MQINVNCRIPVARESESDFVVPILVDIVAPGKFSIDSAHDDLDSEYIVGRVWAERLDWFLAETLGFSPVHLCDAASSTWLQVYETLMSKKRNGFRKDLHLEDMVDDLVFVHEFLIHPEVPDRLPLLDAALRSISSNQSLVLMYHEPTEPPPVDDWELRDLGFKKIARSSLLLRDNQYRYPFGDAHPGGRAVEFAANAEHEEWLLDHWNSLIADHPSL
ncbi:MAG: hypothetical protein IT422_09155 [Pirellulaceae bacterium]|nr:hypothetical protein [Pirellulaceae bacterium]